METDPRQLRLANHVDKFLTHRLRMDGPTVNAAANEVVGNQVTLVTLTTLATTQAKIELTLCEHPPKTFLDRTQRLCVASCGQSLAG